MIAGMNTDVRFGGAVYHVQTEDSGPKRAELVSLVYVGGKILRRVSRAYGELDGGDEPAVRQLLVAQHRTVIQAILRGKLPLAVADAATHERPSLVVSPLEQPRLGRGLTLLILLRNGTTFGPLAGASVEVALTIDAGGSESLAGGRTDARGFWLAELKLPDAGTRGAVLTIDASSARAELAVLPARTRLAEPERARPAESPVLVVSDLEPPRAGTNGSFMVLLRAEPSCRPIAAADVRVRYMTDEQSEPRVLLEARTGPKGFCLLEPELPAADPGSRPSMLIEASTPLGVAEFVLPVVVSV